MKKIIDNLYLGDRFSAPKETKLRISCAEEIFYEVNDNIEDKNQNDILISEKNDVIYYKFEDYPKLENMKKETIKNAISQIENNIANKQIYVHCLWGINRSASIVFMYMVRNKLIDGNSYQESQKNFWNIYPDHKPNPGWKFFLEKNYPYNF